MGEPTAGEVPLHADVPDDVDDLLAAWVRERPGLEVEPLAVFSRVTRLARRLDIARRRTFADHGLEVWAFDVLAALRRAGPPYELTPGRLVAETLVSSGTMTNRVDRLVERGLVARAGVEEDRRLVLVRLTDAGAGLVDAALTDLLAQERAALAGLEPADRAALATLLRRLSLAFARATTTADDAPG